MASAVATFSTAPQVLEELEVSRPGIQTDARDGFVQRRQTANSVNSASDKAETRAWRLKWPVGTLTDRTAILSAWNASQGGTLPLTWTPIDESTSIEVRFRGPLRDVRRTPTVWDLGFTFEEDF